ncbi:MAG: NAD-dependent epimerase/dehydratase family protein [Chloroflexota bacterium]
MKVLIAGVDGYLGWPLAQYLAARGHIVAGIDKFLRRQWVEEIGGHSALPIASIEDRLQAFQERYNQNLIFRTGDLQDYNFLKSFLSDFHPDAIVHLGEMPSAPYSMMDQEHAVYTQQNNVVGSLNLLWAIKETCPTAHLVKLGTMGEYGTPNVDIPEGFFEIEYRGRKDNLPFPRQANSFYHLSKVHDSNNTMFACRVWGLSATDIMQGVVFGTQIDEMENVPGFATRLDFDQCFGTAINRFCCQTVIGHPLTLFGGGSQTRGFLPLRDSMQCITLCIENPAGVGEYRVFNQFEETHNLESLAKIVQEVAKGEGLAVDIRHYDNPRKEMDKHYYNPDRRHLIELGYKPSGNLRNEIKLMINDLLQNRDRIFEKRSLLVPDIRWDGIHRRSEIVHETIPQI